MIAGSAGIDALRVQPRRHPGRIAGGMAILLVVLALLRSVVANPNFQWPVVGQYLFAKIILHGLATTLLLTACTMAIGIAGGTALAMMRLADNPIAGAFASAYIWLFPRHAFAGANAVSGIIWPHSIPSIASAFPCWRRIFCMAA